MLLVTLYTSTIISARTSGTCAAPHLWPYLEPIGHHSSAHTGYILVRGAMLSPYPTTASTVSRCRSYSSCDLQLMQTLWFARRRKPPAVPSQRGFPTNQFRLSRASHVSCTQAKCPPLLPPQDQQRQLFRLLLSCSVMLSLAA